MSEINREIGRWVALIHATMKLYVGVCFFFCSLIFSCYMNAERHNIIVIIIKI